MTAKQTVEESPKEKALKLRDALVEFDARAGTRTVWTVRGQEELAVFFGVSIDTIKNWCKYRGENPFPREKSPISRGYEYRLDKVIQWLRNHGPWRDSRLKTGGDGEVDDRARRLKAQADWEEMRVEREAGTLVPVERYEQMLGRIADAVRTLGEEFGRSAVPISGRDAQRRVNDMVEAIDWSR